MLTTTLLTSFVDLVVALVEWNMTLDPEGSDRR